MASKITNEDLLKQIVKDYDPDDAKFGEKANQRVAAHFASLPKSTSKKDPQRLGTHPGVQPEFGSLPTTYREGNP